MLLATIEGTSVVTEGVWDSRFQYITELEKFGCDIKVRERVATINGGKELAGCEVMATDLRAGASMVIAGLAADGQTKVCQLRHIFRGYEHIVDKLKALGAEIELTDEE